MSSSTTTTATDAAHADAHMHRQSHSADASTNGFTPLLAAGQPEVVIKRHAKYFKRFLELLPAKLALHDSTR